MLTLHPERVIQLIKRRMGVDGFFVTIDGRDYYPAQISAKILEAVVRDALVALGVKAPAEGPTADVVITVPAYFADAGRAATREAGEIANLNVLGIINEPTAAAVAYGLTRDAATNTVLVFDLGGGTFDVTVVETSKTLIRAVATGGDRELGGADWDAVLHHMVLARFREQHPEARDPSTDEEAMGALDILVEDIKKRLSSAAQYTGHFTADTRRARIEITRTEFEEHTADLVERTMQYTELVLDAAARKGVTRLDDVILVGGMSRVPVIARTLHERLRRRFGDAPEPHLVDPDQIVAKGAAMYAAAKVAERYDGGEPRDQVVGPLPPVQDIAARGYGIKTVRGEHDRTGYVSWLIEPNDDLPASPQETYATANADQTEVDVVVYESATNVLNDVLAVNNVIVQGTLRGLPPRQPAGQQVTVTFLLTGEGILDILATGPTGQRLNLEYRRPGSVPPEERDRPLPDLGPA